VDQVQNKNDLLPLIQEIDAIHHFGDYVPISALNSDGIDDLMQCIKKYLPENIHLYPAEPEKKEMPDNFFISELVREKIIRSLGDELPHETYVVVETKAMEGKMLSIGVIIYVARDSQKSIVIGHQGTNLKRIGQQTRVELEKMIHKKVLLKTFVKVNKNWNNDAQYLSSLGVGSNQDAT
jgi:GTP-binding protein Era